MKTLFAVVTAAVLSTSVFAVTSHHHKHHGLDGEWSGKGHWKSADGTSGKWNMSTTFKSDKDGVNVEESITINLPDGTTKTMNEASTSKHVKAGFMDIYKSGNKVGNGYCGYKQCHFEGEENGDKWEETVTFHKGKMYRLGSHTTNDSHVMWQGVMEKVKTCTDCGCKKGCGDEHSEDWNTSDAVAPAPPTH